MRGCSVLAAAAIVAALIGTASPALSQVAPRVLGCANVPDQAMCRAGIEQIRQEGPALARGVYQAMRNAALCQWDGCDGAVAIDRKSSCAWRREIMRRHSRPGGEADRGDEMHLGRCASAGY